MAVVIVVHDDISLMRATLEEAAVVVEHIVSANGLRVWAKRGGGDSCFLSCEHPESTAIPLALESLLDQTRHSLYLAYLLFY